MSSHHAIKVPAPVHVDPTHHVEDIECLNDEEETFCEEESDNTVLQSHLHHASYLNNEQHYLLQQQQEEEERQLEGFSQGDCRDDAHPYLDVEQQRLFVASEKWREHVKWCDRLAVAQRLSFDNRRVALKILINEAFSRDLAFCRARTDFTAESERILRQEWKMVADRILRDMEVEDNSSLVLRNLSCMCIFIPQDVSRQYGENHESRMRRMENMREGLRRLQQRGVLFHSDEGTMGSSSSSDGQTSEENDHATDVSL